MNIWWRINQKVHISWQITAALGGVLLGIALSLLPSMAIFAHWYWLALAAGLLVVAFAKGRRWLLLAAAVAGMLIGLWRGTLERVELDAYSGLIGTNVELVGQVFEDPSVGIGSEVRLRLIGSQVGDRQLPGQIWVSLIGASQDIKRSDRVTVSGKLKSGFGTFPASISYGQLVRVEPLPGADPAREMRDEFGEQLEKVIDQPAQNLGMGILAGEKTALPTDIAEAFRAAGLTHIVVASGYNLMILIRFARRLFAKISRLAALLGAGGLMLTFASVTGFSPSMSRAALVAGLSLLAWYFGRKFHPVVLILTVAAATALINPYYVWGDAGWYMSFSAFIGVIMLSPLIQDYFFGKPVKQQKSLLLDLRQIFIETTSAQILIAPVIAIFLGQFAPYGLLANLLVLPIVPLAMLLTFLAGIAAWLAPAVAGVIAWPAEQLLSYIIWIAQQVASLPGAAQRVYLGIYGLIAAIGLIVLAMVYMQRRSQHSFRADNVIE